MEESKAKASNYLINVSKDRNLKYIIIRPFLIYGPGQSINRLIPNTIINCLKNKKFPCSSGNQIRDFIFLDDFNKLLIKLLKNKEIFNQILNVGSGKPIKVKKIINLVKKLVKKGNPIFGKIPLRKDEPLKLYPNLNKIFKLLDWRPKTNILNGLRKTIKYYRKWNY